MSPKDKILTFRPDEQVYAAMERMREEDGVPFSEQIRRALRSWLTDKGKMPPVLSARAEVGAMKRRHGKVVDQRIERTAKRRK